jgi:hypothetical protein
MHTAGATRPIIEDSTMYELIARILPAPRYFLSYSAALAHARELGLSKRSFKIHAVPRKATQGA